MDRFVGRERHVSSGSHLIESKRSPIARIWITYSTIKPHNSSGVFALVHASMSALMIFIKNQCTGNAYAGCTGDVQERSRFTLFLIQHVAHGCFIPAYFTRFV